MAMIKVVIVAATVSKAMAVVYAAGFIAGLWFIFWPSGDTVTENERTE
jgi:hypothetical protein